MTQKGIKVYHLNIGQPDIETPHEMMDAVKNGNIKVLEYNVRFGDPETQSLLAMMGEEEDLAEIMLACIERRLDCIPPLKQQEGKQAAVTVVLASGGYPESYKKGIPISIKAPPEGRPSVPTFPSELLADESDYRRLLLPCWHSTEGWATCHCWRTGTGRHSYWQDTARSRRSGL